MGREGMAEGMAGRVCGDAGLTCCIVEGSLDGPLVEVMTTRSPVVVLCQRLGAGKIPLPAPLGRRIGVLPRQSVGEVDPPQTQLEVARANASPSSGALRGRLSRKQYALRGASCLSSSDTVLSGGRSRASEWPRSGSNLLPRGSS